MSAQELGMKTVESLKKNRFAAAYYENAEQMMEALLEVIPLDAVVGIGGSSTLMDMKVTEKLEARGNKVLDHNRPGLSPEVVLDLRRQQQVCDIFLTSSNAVTEDGKLVNMDGTGNRVAAMMFGPKKVIVIAGVNKIVPTLADAEERIRKIAAPLNNKRLNRPNPCVKTGYCMDCQLDTRICNMSTVLHKKPPLVDSHVWIVGEQLGY